ncbi:hypothetical protein ACFLZL_02420 [Thermodesulfobacteriota bacterium]
MKKKTDPQHYLTDSLITSDEWDSFDYNLRSQIKDLEKHYDSLSDDRKKSMLAHTYLYHVEKLLKERKETGNQAIENIHELQTLIKKYDHFKTFLLTLRIATTAYRAGLVPELVIMGHTHSKGQSKKGQTTPKALPERNRKIIEHFKKTHLTQSSFSTKHAARYGLKPRQIRNILKKAVGNQPG